MADVTKADLEPVLINVAQLLDGWHADVAWTEWDEDVRHQVSVLLAKLNDVPPPPREAFSHPR